MNRITPLKNLGQNFLQDQNIANKIINLLGDINGKTIYEIGPGMGALTNHLLNSFAKVNCVEVDPRAIEYLKEKYANYNNINILHSDIRDIYLTNELQKPITIVGNIPYNITNEIIFWLLDNCKNVDYAVLTIQKEVAERYTAKNNSKQYGITTLALQLYCTTKICFTIPPAAFFPRPKVNSAVILLDFTNKDLYKYIDKKGLIELIRSSFSQRRKVLRNALKSFIAMKNINIEDLQNQLESHRKPYLSMRAEQLTLEDYIFLFSIIFSNK